MSDLKLDENGDLVAVFRPLFVETDPPVRSPEIRPVRWWRTDENRYVSRGAYVAPKPTGPQWVVESLTDTPGLREIAAMIDAIPGLLHLARSLGLPLDVLNGSGSYALTRRR